MEYKRDCRLSVFFSAVQQMQRPCILWSHHSVKSTNYQSAAECSTGVRTVMGKITTWKSFTRVLWLKHWLIASSAALPALWCADDCQKRVQNTVALMKNCLKLDMCFVWVFLFNTFNYIFVFRNVEVSRNLFYAVSLCHFGWRIGVRWYNQQLLKNLVSTCMLCFACKGFLPCFERYTWQKLGSFFHALNLTWAEF